VTTFADTPTPSSFDPSWIVSTEPAPVPEQPEVRQDGLCVVCLKPRKCDRSVKYGGSNAEADPFCSTVCARTYYGTLVLTSKEQEAADDDAVRELRAA